MASAANAMSEADAKYGVLRRACRLIDDVNMQRGTARMGRSPSFVYIFYSLSHVEASHAAVSASSFFWRKFQPRVMPV